MTIAELEQIRAPHHQPSAEDRADPRQTRYSAGTRSRRVHFAAEVSEADLLLTLGGLVRHLVGDYDPAAATRNRHPRNSETVSDRTRPRREGRRSRRSREVAAFVKE
jgi:hypothetical protein